MGTAPDRLEELLRSMDDVGARAALVRAAAAHLCVELDAVTAKRRATLAKVGVPWLGVALAALPPDEAHRLAHADRRRAAAAALERAHPGTTCAADGCGDTDFDARVLHRARPALTEGELRRALAAAPSLGPYEQRVALREYLHAEVMVRSRLAATAAEVFGHCFRTDPSLFLPHVPDDWWRAAGPLDDAGVAKVSEHVYDAGDVTAIVGLCGIDPATAPAALSLLGPVASGGDAVLADHLVRATGAPVPNLCLDADDALDALAHLAPGAVRSAVLDALWSGEFGQAWSDHSVEVLAELEPSPDQLVNAVHPEQLPPLLAGADEDRCVEVIALLDPRDLACLVEAAPDPQRAQLVPLCATHGRGLLAGLTRPWLCEDLAAELLERATAALGADELSWSQLWVLADGWTGTLDQALDCVHACTR